VVGGVDGGFVLVELLFVDESDGGETDEEQAASPDVRDEVLLAAGFVPEAAEEGDAAEEGCGERYEGKEDEVGKPAQGEGDGGLCGGLWGLR
jgi:hypothetical protein